MKRPRPRSGTPKANKSGPSQRQLRAGELVRHALAEILREAEIQDPDVHGISITVTEVRMSPDLRNALCFVEPLGGEKSETLVAGLNRASKYLRGQLARMVDLKFLPDLKFRHDESYEAAAHMSRLFDQPKVKRDLDPFAKDKDS